MRPGDKVWFKPKKNKPRMQAEIAFPPTGKLVDIIVGSDPFPVTVKVSQISACKETGNTVSSNKQDRKVSETEKKETRTMTTTAEPSAKELRKQAQGLGIEDWEGMGRKELAKAIAAAEKAESSTSKPKAKKGKKSKNKKNKPKGSKPKASKPETEETDVPAKAKTKSKKGVAKKTAPAKTAGKKAPAKKVAAPKAEKPSSNVTLAKSHPKPTPAEGVNPFRKKSNLYHVARLLLQGGKREVLARKLAEKITLHPYQKDTGEIDLLDYDKRLLLGAQNMRDQFGYGIERTGRGTNGSILVFIPGGKKDPRAKSSKAKSKK